MYFELKSNHLFKIWKFAGLAPIKIVKTDKGKSVRFSKLALVQTVLIFIICTMAHLHYMRVNWQNFKSKRYFLQKPMQILPRLTSSLCMALTNAIFLISSPVIARKLIRFQTYFEAVENKINFENNFKFNGNASVIYSYLFYSGHISFHFLACLIISNWKELNIVELGSIVLMYFNDFIILAGGMRWFYVVYQLNTKFHQLNTLMKSIITWKHSYVKDFPVSFDKGTIFCKINLKINSK